MVSKPFWFQLYMFRDRGFSESVIERARAAKCSALFVTVDLPMRGQRHADIKNGLTVPPRLTVRNAFDIATKPAWALKVLLGQAQVVREHRGLSQGPRRDRKGRGLGEPEFRPLAELARCRVGSQTVAGQAGAQGRARRRGRQDRRPAGVDGIVVSNHGGRQLDGAPSTIRVLPDIASAVGDRIEVLFDGGIRSGHDVLKALALARTAA